MIDRALDVEYDWAREATPNASPRLHRLLDRAIETAGLAETDVYALADWIATLDAVAADRLGLILVALMLAVAEGSLAIELSAASLHRRLDDLADGLDSWIDDALADLRAGRFALVIGDGRLPGDVVRRPLLTWVSGDRRFLYFQKHFVGELDADTRLRERALRPHRALLDAEVARALDEVLTAIPLRAGGAVVDWDPDQLTVLGLALLRDLVVISGGPGTGKTSVVFTLLRCLARLGVPVERIALAAPTGRAAQRLSDALRGGVENLGPDAADVDRALATRSALTLHKLLEYWPTRNIYRRHEENPIPADVVLVDEVSMVSVEMMANLLRALEPGARLILLGDKDQLPSVDAGAVLGQLAPENDAPALSPTLCRQIERWLPGVGQLTSGPDHWLRDSVVMLRTNHRSEHGIRETANSINAQDAAIVDRLPKFAGDWGSASERGGCWWWPQTLATAAELRGQLHRWAEHVYDTPLPVGGSFFELANERQLTESESPECRAWLTKLFAALERTRLLTLVREGPWGCGPINETMQLWLARRAGRRGAWLPGTPILVTGNDYVRGLFNGDVGLTIAGQGGAARIVFSRQGGFLSMAPESLPSHELGFALTVHKSQGSEFQQALIVLPPTGGRRLLTKELIYTGITRAKKLAIVSGTDEAFRTAIGRRIVRESGMNK